MVTKNNVDWVLDGENLDAQTLNRPLDQVVDSINLELQEKLNSDDPRVSEWDQAYSWGNHQSAGYLTTQVVSGKVDKVPGKDLSTNDFTTEEKNKLAGIADGAQVNSVISVAGKTGVVTLVKADVGLANVDNTSDLNKPVSTATQTALDAKAALSHTHDAGSITSGTLAEERLPAIPISKVTGLKEALGSSTTAFTLNIAYDNRATLRSTPGATGDQALVNGLGLFVFQEGSDEPDDDESCFATNSGRWLLECPHWDVVDTWQLPDNAVRDEYDEDEHLRFDLRFESKVLSGTATCAITAVAAISSASFTGTVTGAAVGDCVIATPPGDMGWLSYHAWVSSADTITVMLTNASASNVNTNTDIRTAWPITVIKS